MNVLKPHLQTTIRTQLEAGVSQRENERVTGISRHTIRSWQRRFATERANCPGVATDGAEPIAPLWPSIGVTPSACEPYREFIEAQLRLKRNATAIYQDLADRFGFAGAYNSVKRFAARLKHEPEQFDRLDFPPGEEMQVDYGEGAPDTGSREPPVSPAAAFRGHVAPFPRELPPCGVAFEPAGMGRAPRTGVASLRRILPLCRSRQPVMWSST